MFQPFIGANLIVPLIAGAIWFVLAPIVVGMSDPRLKMRNPDHFARLVRISRTWGIVACMVGFVVAYAF